MPPRCKTTPTRVVSSAVARTGIEPEDPRRAAVGAAVALERLDGRRLAGPVGAQEGYDLAASASKLTPLTATRLP